LSLALTLRLRNEQELHSLLRELYDPASPNYRQFLTVQQFTERFGPTIEDYERVTDFAKSYGLTVTHTAPNRLVLDVRGTVSDIEQAFRVTMQVYQHPTKPRTFYAPDAEPSVDLDVPVQGVSGLNNFSPPHPISLRRVPSTESVRTSSTGSGPGGAFLGSDIRAAYMPGVTLDGSG
jgi:subtilase family serine protease